mmetsp:Transcript_9990/g.15113  ORF Transcript_9990/g.15113 Transcript_9990/m.15113 type:complete len:199 (+) Transcript_9990:258-854(+)
MHNAFTTKIPRFCPTAPGSGMISGPSYLTNPDPGQHHKAPKWNDLKYLDKTLLKYKSKEHKDLRVIPQSQAPSIPTKKLAQTSYTGRGQDTVGPAAYNPKIPTVKQNAPEFDFATSKIDRKIFEQHNMAHNNMCWAKNPGPGVYDFEKPAAKQFNATGESHTFQSKVPNCKDSKVKNIAPGPGNYKTVKSIEKEATDA